MARLSRDVDALAADLVALRRDLHQNPELAWAERRTAARVAAFLEGSGLEVRSDVAGTGVVATVRGGSGRTVLLRVDMDGLPIQEQGQAPYASRVAGVMHACGHDGHTAIGAAAARVLVLAEADVLPASLDGTVAAYRRLARSYTRLHPNVTIRLLRAPDAAAARADREHGADPDVFLAEHAEVPALAAADDVQPVDELLEKRGVLFGDNFQRLGLEAFSADTALQCMPHDVSPLVVYYNERLVRPPTRPAGGVGPVSGENAWTWQQFARAASHAAGGRTYGFYLPPTLEALLPLVRSAGADLVDEQRSPRRLTTGEPGVRAALTRILETVREPGLVPPHVDTAAAVDLFARGRLGMLVATRAVVPRLRAAASLRFDVFPLPSLGTPRTVAEMSGYCISARSRHIPAAADFLAYASGPEGASITAATGGIVPANLRALHSPAFLQPGEQPRHAEVYVDALGRADAMPFSARWALLEEREQPLLERLFAMPPAGAAPATDRLLTRMERRSERVLTPPSPSGSASP
jgi:multiple sugar transport system substrate-binding protein